jgi:hypothetical protein
MSAANGEEKEQSGEPSPKKKATPSKRKAGMSSLENIRIAMIAVLWLTYL